MGDVVAAVVMTGGETFPVSLTPNSLRDDVSGLNRSETLKIRTRSKKLLYSHFIG
jgi:hypothetical protein